MEDICNKVKSDFENVLLPQNFHYRDQQFPKFKIAGVSAILIVLNYIDDKWMVLMNVRSKKLRRHPGEVCFPGGMRELHIDHTPVETAIREADEEIGLKRDDIHVIGTLRPLITRTSIVIYPVLSIVKNALKLPEFFLNSEVEQIFWTSLDNFLDNKLHRCVTLKEDFTIHAFLLKKPVFGITAVLAIAVAIGLFNQFPKFEYEMLGGKKIVENAQRTPQSYLFEIFNLFGEWRPPISPELIRSKSYSKL